MQTDNHEKRKPKTSSLLYKEHLKRKQSCLRLSSEVYKSIDIFGKPIQLTYKG